MPQPLRRIPPRGKSQPAARGQSFALLREQYGESRRFHRRRNLPARDMINCRDKYRSYRRGPQTCPRPQVCHLRFRNRNARDSAKGPRNLPSRKRHLPTNHHRNATPTGRMRTHQPAEEGAPASAPTQQQCIACPNAMHKPPPCAAPLKRDRAFCSNSDNRAAQRNAGPYLRPDTWQPSAQSPERRLRPLQQQALSEAHGKTAWQP